MLHRAKCWEYQKCGREEGGINAAQLGICPAYPDDGRSCWRVAGTMCEGEVQGTVAQKRDNCESCNWFKNIKTGLA
jgi:hypothetical protein